MTLNRKRAGSGSMDLSMKSTVLIIRTIAVGVVQFCESFAITRWRLTHIKDTYILNKYRENRSSVGEFPNFISSY